MRVFVTSATGFTGSAALAGGPVPESATERQRAREDAKLSFTRKDRNLLLAIVALLALIFALVYSNVAANHAPKPRGVPIGVIASPQALNSVALALGPGTAEAYRIHGYSSVQAARIAILNRAIYGAFRPSPSPLLLVASAASPAVSALLTRTFTGVAHRQGQDLAVRELAPLPSTDPAGATGFSALLSLLLAGTMGSSIIYLLGRHRPPAARLAAAVGLGIGAGLLTALITNVIVGAFTSRFLAVWGIATLFAIAISLPISAFQALLGNGGTAIGAIMFLVIGNPASGGASAPELLPAPWREVSQLLPPGAAATAIRDAVYFQGHRLTHALLVLGLYASLGAAVALAVPILRARTPPAGAASQIPAVRPRPRRRVGRRSNDKPSPPVDRDPLEELQPDRQRAPADDLD
jgi:hypothetical protein